MRLLWRLSPSRKFKTIRQTDAMAFKRPHNAELELPFTDPLLTAVGQQQHLQLNAHWCRSTHTPQYRRRQQTMAPIRIVHEGSNLIPQHSQDRINRWLLMGDHKGHQAA